MKKIFIFSLIFILATGLFSSCEKKGDPPVLPPAESMLIDFSEFVDLAKSAVVPGENKGLAAVENTNWTVAATVAGVWNTILVYYLAVPVASFHLAINNDPAYLDNKKWEWKYTANVVGATYIARLTGQILADEVKWEMYITREGVSGFAEFLWFEGTTDLEGMNGQWIMNQSPENQVPMLQIDWERTGTKISSVTYTYTKPGEPFTGSYIEYGLTSNTLDAFFNVHYYDINKEKFVDVDIEWSTTIHNGRVMAPDFFSDADNPAWHCWNANGNDEDCLTK